MKYYCFGCGEVVTPVAGGCRDCHLREDVNSVINHLSHWKSLNEEAQQRFIEIIALGLEHIDEDVETHPNEKKVDRRRKDFDR